MSKDSKIHNTLAEFMQAIEEWSSEVDGTPKENDMLDLDEIYMKTTNILDEIYRYYFKEQADV